MFERRIRYRRGGGCWRDWRPPGSALRTCLDRPSTLDLVVPPIADWTRDTVAQVIAMARAQLVARRATGRGRITARVNSRYRVNGIELTVRVGDLRTRVNIDAGRIVFAVPLDVVTALAGLDPNPDIQRAVQLAQADRQTTHGGR